MYENNYDQNLECEFFFALSDKSAFVQLEAHYDDKIIKGIIKEKSAAKKEYNDAIKAGKTAIYSEIVEELHDVMKVNLGNLKPKQKIVIKFTYIENLKVSMNKFWYLSLPSTLTERYQSQN